MEVPELLAPAGDWTSLRAAVESKCDSVYFGVKSLNMRASAKNFEIEELKKIADYCHKNNVRAYLCINTIVYEDELEKIKRVLDSAKSAGVDAVICWDLGVVKMAKEIGFEVHLSTQASASNSKSLEMYEKLGIDRVILARECSLEQIEDIKKKSNLKIECFIHGARCISVSGRCFISQELFGKSANRGECIQPCRRNYQLVDIEEGHSLEVEHNYILSPKDLCAINFLDKIVESGVDCIKIEGRTRAPEYVKTVVEVYREALDTINSGKFSQELADDLIKKLRTVYNRGFSSGFYLGKPVNDYCGKYGGKTSVKKQFIGIVQNYYDKIGVIEIKLQSGSLKLNDTIMIQGSTTGVKEQKIRNMEIKHKPVEKAEQGKHAAVKIDFRARKNDKVFIIQNN